MYTSLLLVCKTIVEPSEEDLLEERTKGLTFHLALAKFFSICAHTFSLMFLSEAAPPEILLYKKRKTISQQSFILPLSYDTTGD